MTPSSDSPSNEGKPSLSFIIPLMNEQGTLRELHERIAEQAVEHSSDWEIIYIDDGSSDGSWETICELAEEYPENVEALRFRGNVGKSGGLAAGYAEATGKYVFTLDADLQDDPKEIPRFIEKIEEGFDIVSGWKQKRHDPWHKVLPSRVFNLMLSKVNGVKLHDHNCGFKCYRREVVEELPMYGEMHRMVPSLASMSGFKAAEIPVQHHARVYGESKYGVKRFLRGFMDMWSVYFIKNFRERPLHLMGGWAIAMLMLAALFWAVAIMPFVGGKLASLLFAAAPAAAAAAPVLMVIGFLSELLNYREYKQRHELPISERIEKKSTGASERIIPISAGMPQEGRAVVASAGTALVVDDDPLTRSVMAMALEKQGWQVEKAGSAEKALEAMNPSMEVVVLDIYMHGISGLEVIGQIKTMAPHSQVLVISSSETPKDGATAIQNGAFDFLSKPVRPDELVEAANRARAAYQALSPARAVNS